MLLKDYKKKFIANLESLFDPMESESFFFLILDYLHQMKRVDLALQLDFEISDNELFKWNEILSQLKKEKPIQYILGETEFYGLRFWSMKTP